MKRSDVEFTSGGVTCRAWLYEPDAGARPPIIVMAHGLGGVRHMRLGAFAERFADAGYACLVFDYRHFGDSDGEPRGLLSVRRQRADWSAAIAFARSLPQVDGSRVVLWGTSFGGGHVLSVGAGQQVAAVISQCPFTSGLASLRVMEPLVVARVTALAVADAISAVARRGPVRVALAGDPGTTALMTAPDVTEGYLSLIPDGHDFTNAVAARIGLVIPLLSPARALRKAHAPTLVCVCDRDSVAPAGPTIKAAESNPKVTLKRYDEGHFDIYVGDAFEAVIADQVDFLDQMVPLD